MDDYTTPNARPSNTAIILSTIDSLWDRHDEQQAKLAAMQAAGDRLAEKLKQVITSKRWLLKILPKTKDPQILAGRQSVITDLEEALAAWNQAKEMR